MLARLLPVVGLLAVAVLSLNFLLVDEGKTSSIVQLWTVEKKIGDVPFRRWLSEANDRSLQGGDAAADVYGTVHTFFSPIDPHTRLPSDALNATDRAMLDTWTAAWESQGWKTRILTMDDARAHPEFESYDRKLDRVPLGSNAYYNRLCYLRWLAMANLGGGFMSDYDTVPLRPPPSSPAEFPERFTVYGGAVPSLVGGSGEEWERMVKVLFSSAVLQSKKVKRRLWSDMMILQELNKNDRYYVTRRETLTGRDALSRLAFTSGDCNYFRSDANRRTGGFRLVHFSHGDMESEQYPHRPEIMRDWMQEWSAKCNGVELRLDVPAIEAALREQQRSQPQPKGMAMDIQRPREGFSWERLREVTTVGQ